ncbi:MAG TPA: helix-turn-helix domain-containing protein [Bryobacteraceae bacterium]|nr:helix-turn-helix domain-containing protein [Bryobacteraceae bacterium]
MHRQEITADGGGAEAGTALERRIAERLAALRGERGWPLDALAERTGISRATLSRIERGELSPSAALLNKLCAAYGWTLSRLIAEAESQPLSVIRADEQVVWQDPESRYVRRAVSPPGAGLRGELVEVRFPAGAVVEYDRPPVAGLEHHLWLLEGLLDLTVDGKTFRLRAGDCLRYVLRGPTRFECPGKRGARYVIAMVHP